MVSIYDLLKEEKELIEEIRKVSKKVVLEEDVRKQHEANLWLTTDFKKNGATNDKQRNAVVTSLMGQEFPPFTLKAKLNYLNLRLKFVKHCVDVMRDLGVSELEFEESENKK